MIAETEINAATDNPLFFESDERWDHQFCENWPKEYKGDQRISYSAGNFHGEPIGMAADFLAVGLAELANISERRIQMLLDAHHNRNLPGNLVSKRGVNSGYMIAQYCAAGLVSENKVLAHPASVDSIPTSANAEDHNAMATIAARKLRSVLHNAQAVLAIELLVAVQAIDWRVGMGISPCLKASGSGDERLQERGSASDQAEWEASEFERRTDPEHRLAIVAKLGRGTRLAYSRIRGLVPPLITDRTLDGEICIIRGVLENNSLITSLSRELQEPLRPIVPLMTRL
jgi:histidine ammonia-lyase